MGYKALYLDPRWQKKRLEVMERADFACEWCDNRGTTLHVHHTHYLRGRKPWEYEDESLLCLCGRCHEIATRQQDELSVLIGRIGDIETLIGVARALAAYHDTDGSPEGQIKVDGSETARGTGLVFGLTERDVIDNHDESTGTVDVAVLHAMERCRRVSP